MDNPVRVLQIFTTMNRGGAESMIMNYYRRFDRSKIQFDFLVHREEKGAFEDEIEQLGGKIYRMPKINPFFPFPYYKKLDAFFKQHNYKLVHSHINTFSQFPLKIAKQNNVPCRIAHAHTTTLPLDFKLITKKPIEAAKLLYNNIIKSQSKKEATLLFACGKRAGIWLFGNNGYEVLTNAINSQSFIFNEETRSRFRREFGFEDSFVIGHIGNFSFPKNYPLILSIFKEIRNRKTNGKLILIGDGLMKTEIINQSKSLNIFEDILFLGIRDDVSELLQVMDVLLFPSLFEGLPVTLIEAQAAGLKVFASDSITDEAALTDDVSFISLKESPDYWAEKIVSAIPYERKDNSEIIKSKGYDIVESSRKLQNFYLEQLRCSD